MSVKLVSLLLVRNGWNCALVAHCNCVREQAARLRDAQVSTQHATVRHSFFILTVRSMCGCTTLSYCYCHLSTSKCIVISIKFRPLFVGSFRAILPLWNLETCSKMIRSRPWDTNSGREKWKSPKKDVHDNEVRHNIRYHFTSREE